MILPLIDKCEVYIPSLDHFRKLGFNSIVHLTSIYKQTGHARVILCKKAEVHIFKDKLYISALERVRVLILGRNVLLGVINPIL